MEAIHIHDHHPTHTLVTNPLTTQRLDHDITYTSTLIYAHTFLISLSLQPLLSNYYYRQLLEMGVPECV